MNNVTLQFSDAMIPVLEALYSLFLMFFNFISLGMGGSETELKPPSFYD